MQNNKKIDLIATISDHKEFDDRPYGYQIGSVESNAWLPLVICSAQFSSIQDAANAAEAQLARTERAIYRQKMRNMKKKILRRVPSSTGPGAA